MKPNRPTDLYMAGVILLTAITLSGRTALGLEDQAKITLVQLTDKGDADSVIQRMPAFFEQAAEYGSDLVVFPEYVLGRNITLQDPNVQKFFALAKEHKIYAIAGLVESHGEKWTTTALVVDRSGNLLGRYFKTHPASGPPPHFWPPVKAPTPKPEVYSATSSRSFISTSAPSASSNATTAIFPKPGDAPPSRAPK